MVSANPTPRPRKLLDRVRDALRLKHYSIRTEQAHIGWIRRYILFHNKRHPQDMGTAEIEAFLTYLAVQKNVAASTQNQARSAVRCMLSFGKSSVVADGILPGAS
jgi:hypothetical protein